MAHYISGSPLDFALFYYNFNEIFVPEVLISIFLWSQSLIGLLLLGFLGLGIWLLHRQYSLLSLKPVSNTMTLLILNAIFYFPTLTFTSNHSAGLAFLLKSGYMSLSNHSDRLETGKENPFPYVTYRPHRSSVSSKNNPHVFIIVVESFNAGYVEAKTSKGESYTPFFDSLISQGLYFENFYSNSIQTARSQFSILCGVLPSFKGKVFTQHSDLNLNCLPKILQPAGYTSLFFKAYRSLKFDNTDQFTGRIGFNYRRGMDSEFIQKEDKPFIWGWGLQDNIFYRKYFSFLDAVNEQQPDQLFFSMLTTVTNHMMFDKIPLDQRYLYESPQNISEHYANSIHLTDRYLREFFTQLQSRDYLSNSIVIITGDNSYPVGEHGYTFNETSFYNEFFKTPLLIINTKTLKKQRIQKAFSHVDIAPTLLEILDIETKHHFVGSSLLTGIKPDGEITAQTENNHYIYFSQPHSGIFLGTINFPYKYVHHEISGQEFLYDIESDPGEQNNLIEKNSLQSVIQKLREKNKFHYFNQRLIEENRIWPNNEKAATRVATEQAVLVFQDQIW